MHVSPDSLSPELSKKLKEAGETDAVELARAYDESSSRNPQKLFHEAYHFWQLIRLPFLYRYATLGFTGYFEAFRALARQSPDYETWDYVDAGLVRLELEGCLWGSPGESTFAFSKSETARPSGHIAPSLVTTPLALMENAASLAEFETFSPGEDRLNAVTFQRWLRRNPAYTEVFRYVSKALNDETLALYVFTPMVNAAFHTSDPVRAFATLLARVREILTDPDNRDAALASPHILDWSALMKDLVERLPFDCEEDADANILTPKFFKISLNTWLNGSYGEGPIGSLEHPMIPAAARLWEEASRFPEMTLAIDHPSYLSPAQRAIVTQKFFPPITVTTFHFLDGTTRPVMWGNIDMISSFFGRSGIGIANLFAIYSSTRRAGGAHFDSDHRTCHWAACPHFGPNYCNSYPGIPKDDFTRCTFPKGMSALISTIGSL